MEEQKPLPKTGQIRSLNTTEFDLRQKMQELLEAQFQNIVQDFSMLTPKDRVSLWLKMAEFNSPKMRHIEHDIVRVNYDGGAPKLNALNNEEQ